MPDAQPPIDWRAWLAQFPPIESRSVPELFEMLERFEPHPGIDGDLVTALYEGFWVVIVRQARTAVVVGL